MGMQYIYIGEIKRIINLIIVQMRETKGAYPNP